MICRNSKTITNSKMSDTELSQDLNTKAQILSSPDSGISDKKDSNALEACSSSESVKRKVESTDPENEISPKKVKPNKQVTTNLPNQKRSAAKKSRTTIPISPKLWTSRLRKRAKQVRDKTVDNPKGKDLEFKAAAARPSKTVFKQGFNEIPLLKCTTPVSPNLATKARAISRLGKEGEKKPINIKYQH